MLKLTRLTDYAILILGALAMRPTDRLSSHELANYTQLGQPTVAKLTKMLVAAELIESSRGVHGGCTLLRMPEQISVADVVEAIEGPIALPACVEGAVDPCAVQNGCFMSGNWNRVNGAIHQALSGVSLAEMFNPEEIFPVLQIDAADRATQDSDNARQE